MFKKIVSTLSLFAIVLMPFAGVAQAFDVTVSGVASNMHYRNSVRPFFSANDGATASATINGRSFPSGQWVNDEGTYGLVVTVRKGGEVKTVSRNFTIDKTAPQVHIGNVSQSHLYNANVKPTFSATDNIRLQNVSATLDGYAFSSGSTVTGEGNHGITVTARDAAGNTTIQNLSFSIDKTAPIITIGGVKDGVTYGLPNNTHLTITYSTNEGTAVGYLNGAKFNSGKTVSANGNYRVEVIASDAAGNVSTKVVNFAISKSGDNNNGNTTNNETNNSETTNNNYFYRYLGATSAMAQNVDTSNIQPVSADNALTDIRFISAENADGLGGNLNSCRDIRIIGKAKEGLMIILYLKRDGSDMPVIGFVRATTGDTFEFVTEKPLESGNYQIYAKAAELNGQTGPLVLLGNMRVEQCSKITAWLWALILLILVLIGALIAWLWLRKKNDSEEGMEDVGTVTTTSRL